MCSSGFIFFSQEHGQEELDQWNLVRVSEDFRVIALGIPVPRYLGNPLDPPLRSRFQARDISGQSFKVSNTFYITLIKELFWNRYLYKKIILPSEIQESCLLADCD
jgi:hypothetical protein